MIQLGIDPSGERTVGQCMTSPCVYLDSCALTDIAEDPTLVGRLRDTLVRRGGTLAISWLNLMELGGITDQRQLQAVANFLDRVSHELIFFIDVVPEQVINREDQLVQEGRGSAPHVDDQILKIFVQIYRKSLHPLSFGEFIPLWRQDRIASMAKTFLDEVTDHLERAREKARWSTKLQARLKEIPKGPRLPCATRYVVIETLRNVAREGIQMDSHHWRDALHMIVPVAYCDFVVLDRTWAAKATQVISRLKTAHAVDMAQVFAVGELDRFWEAFDI